jgi:hypothetical protein
MALTIGVDVSPRDRAELEHAAERLASLIDGFCRDHPGRSASGQDP